MKYQTILGLIQTDQPACWTTLALGEKMVVAQFKKSQKSFLPQNNLLVMRAAECVGGAAAP